MSGAVSFAEQTVPSPRRGDRTASSLSASTSSAPRSILMNSSNNNNNTSTSLSQSTPSLSGSPNTHTSSIASVFGSSPNSRPRRQSITLSPPNTVGPVAIPARQGYNMSVATPTATNTSGPTSASSYGQPSHRLSFSSSSPIEGSPLGPIPFRGHGHGHVKSSSSSLSNLGTSPRDSVLHDSANAGGFGRAKVERRGSYRKSFDAGTLSFGERSNLVRRTSGLEAVQASEGLGRGAVKPARKGEDVEGAWLRIKAREVLEGKEGDIVLVDGQTIMPEAVEALIKSEASCLLVEMGPGSYAFFDYADLNTFLLLVLHATSGTPASSRSASQTQGYKDAQAVREAVIRAGGTGEYGLSDSAIADEGDLTSMDERAVSLVSRLKRGDRVTVGDVCDISQKNPYQAFQADTPLSTILPLFASGLHRVAILDGAGHPKILNDLTILEHLLALPAGHQPDLLSMPASDPSLGMAMHPLISLPGTASILDAMQVLSLNGLSAIGVLSGSGSIRRRTGSSGSSGSSSGSFSRSGTSDRLAASAAAAAGGIASSPRMMAVSSPSAEIASPLESAVGVSAGQGELIGVVTVQDCARLVVPSEGRQALGMGLEAFVKSKQSVEQAGTERGEERVRVHTIAYSSTLAHAAGLILATACCRIFLRLPTGSALSPPASPAPSLSISQSSPPASPLISSLSLYDKPYFPAPVVGTTSSAPSSGPAGSTLPPPPPTQLSPHFVVSTLDILAALAKRYHAHLTPPPGLRHLDNVNVVQPGSALEKDQQQDGGAHALGGAGGYRSRLRGSIILPGPSGRAMAGCEEGWTLDPAALSKKRASIVFGGPAGQTQPVAGGGSGEGQQERGGFENWRWAGRISKAA